MTWAGVVVAGVGAAAGAAGSANAANAAEDAAGAQQDAANLSYADQQKLSAQQRKDAAPYRDSGYNALNQLNYLMGLGGNPEQLAPTKDNFNAEAYRDWRIQQVTDSINKQYGAKNPEKAARKIAKRTAELTAALKDTESAWKQYKQRSNSGLGVGGDFWNKRDVTGEGAGGEGYGFLQQRFNNDVFEKDPGYQFRMDEGNKAVEAGAAARNGLLSGAAMKAMQKYSQGFASNEYGNAYNRYTGDQQNMYNRLAQMAGTGQQQINNTAQMQQSGMQNANSYMMDAANARASGIVGANNARQSGYQQIGNTLMDAYGIYAQQKANAPVRNGSNGYGTAVDGLVTDYGRA